MQWHQLDHMQTICTSLQTDNHINTSSVKFYRPDALPDAQPTVLKQRWQYNTTVYDGNFSDWINCTTYCVCGTDLLLTLDVGIVVSTQHVPRHISIHLPVKLNVTPQPASYYLDGWPSWGGYAILEYVTNQVNSALHSYFTGAKAKITPVTGRR